MIKVSVTNAKEIGDQFDRWINSVEALTADVGHGLTAEIFNYLLQESPQFSGDFAGNWQVSLNAINPDFEELGLLGQIKGKKDVYFKGSMPAIMHAKAANQGRTQGYKVGDAFYIANSAVHDGNKYALKIEAETVNFRQGHQGAVIKRALMAIAPMYERVSAAQVLRLRRRKL